MTQRLIEYPSCEEMEDALSARQNKAKVSIYSYVSTLLHVKKVLFVDWTKFTILVEE